METSSIVIRQANMLDIDHLIRLLEQLFAIEEDFDFNPGKHKKGLLLMLDGCGKHKALKIALVNNTIVGMCTIQTRISTAKGQITAVLEDLVVDKDHRAKGIGKALLDHMLQWALKRNITNLQLLADRENKAALEFYKNQHWKATQLVCLTKNLIHQT